MDRFVKVTKPGIDKSDSKSSYEPPVFLAPATAATAGSPQKKALQENRRRVGEKLPTKKAIRPRRPITPNAESQDRAPRKATMNPWTLAKGSSEKKPANSTYDSALLIHSDSEKDAAGALTPVRSGEFITQRSNRRKRNKHARSKSQSSLNRVNPAGHGPADAIPSTPKRNDPTKPSPRKKRSPLQLANELYLAGQLITPKSMSKHRESGELFESTEEENRGSPSRVNRKLDFAATPQSRRSPSVESEADSLPSPSALLSPPISQLEVREPEPSPPSKRLPPKKQKSSAKSLVAVRESLEGTWKNISPREVKGLGIAKKVYSSVELLDLTGG